MTMTKTEARRLTRESRSYGWFRPSLYRAEGYRRCPKCRALLWGYGHGRDEALARMINAAIDLRMVEHLLANCDEED